MVLPLLTAAACQTTQPSIPQAEPFKLVGDISPEIRELRNIAASTYDTLGLSPHPEIRLVSPAHRMLGGVRLGRAVVFEGGKEVIYISRDELGEPKRLTGTIEHEAAHLSAWRQFGHGIPEHGSEWRAVCLIAATSRDACKRTFE